MKNQMVPSKLLVHPEELIVILKMFMSRIWVRKERKKRKRKVLLIL